MERLHEAIVGQKRGVWAIYSLATGGPMVTFISEQSFMIMVELSKRGSGLITFWPFNMGINEAIEWWNQEKVNYGAHPVSPPADSSEQTQ